MLKKKAVTNEITIPEILQQLCRPIDSVKLWKDNPRKNDDAAKKLADLIRHNGFRVPIVVDQYGVIRAGNTRYKAAKLLGMTEIPMVVQEFKNDAAATAFALSDNKANEYSQWDDDILERLMKSDGLESPATGFDQKDFDMLTKRLAVNKERELDILPTTTTCKCPKCGFEY